MSYRQRSVVPGAFQQLPFVLRQESVVSFLIGYDTGAKASLLNVAIASFSVLLAENAALTGVDGAPLDEKSGGEAGDNSSEQAPMRILKDILRNMQRLQGYVDRYERKGDCTDGRHEGGTMLNVPMAPARCLRPRVLDNRKDQVPLRRLDRLARRHTLYYIKRVASVLSAGMRKSYGCTTEHILHVVATGINDTHCRS